MLVLVIVHYKCVLGIQVFEEIENDTTTVATSILAPSPTTNVTVTSPYPDVSSSTTAESRIVQQISTTEHPVIPLTTSTRPTKLSRIQSSLKPKKERYFSYLCI